MVINMANEGELATSFEKSLANFIVVSAVVKCDDARTTTLINDDEDGIETGYGKQMFDVHTEKKYFESGKFSGLCPHIGNKPCDLDLYKPWFNAAELQYVHVNMDPLNQYYNEIKSADSAIQNIEQGIITANAKGKWDFLPWQRKEKDRKAANRSVVEDSPEVNIRLDGSVADGEADLKQLQDKLNQYVIKGLTSKQDSSYAAATNAISSAKTKLGSVKTMLPMLDLGEIKHPLKKESEAVCWKGGLVTIETTGQELTEEEAKERIAELINEYREEADNTRKAEILQQLQALDPAPVIHKDGDGKRYFGVSSTAWQLKIVGWRDQERDGYNALGNVDVINTTLAKFNILEPQQQRIFFAQCSVETGAGRLTQEEYPPPGGYGGFWGAGYIQLTHEENYQGFKSWLDNNFPEQDFSEVVVPNSGSTYIAHNLPWLAAGYYWEFAGMNDRLAGTYTRYLVDTPDPPQDNLGIGIAIQAGQNANPATAKLSHWDWRDDNHRALENIFVVEEGTSDADPENVPHNSIMDLEARRAQYPNPFDSQQVN